MKGSLEYIINKNLKKLGEIQSFCRGKSSKMCPSWKDTNFMN